MVQFDAIMELNSPRRDSHVLLFARYWVSPDFCCMAVDWAEPHGIGLDLSFYPPSLVIAGDEHGFSIAHDIKPEYVGSYKKPLGERGVFRCMYGDYPVHNLQFVEREVRVTQIRTCDIVGLDSSGRAGEQVLDVPITMAENEGRRAVARVNAHICGDRIDSMQLLGSDDRILKNIDYEYAPTGGQTRLLRQHVQLPEYPVAVGLQGHGIVVRVRDKEYKCMEFQAVHHQGGRNCMVEYAPVLLGDKDG